MTYAERKAAGRPLVTITMTTDTKELLDELADRLGMSRAAVIEEALNAYEKKTR
jgi:predicted transcriptional regulator